MSISSCRVCNDTKSKVYSMFESYYEIDPNESIPIYFAYNSFLEISERLTPESSDKSSSYLCEICTNKLLECYVFAQRIRKNEKELSEVELIEMSIEEDQEYVLLKEQDDNESIPNESQDVVELQEKANESQEIRYVLEETGETKSNEIAEEDYEETTEPPLKKCKNCMPETFSVPSFSFECVSSSTNKSIYNLSVVPLTIKHDKKYDYSFLENISNKSYNDRVYQCKYCEKAFSSEKFLCTHVRNSHLCVHCLKCWKSAKKLSDHTKKAHSNMNCPFCDKLLNNINKMRSHLQSAHLLKLPPYFTIIQPTDQECFIDN